MADLNLQTETPFDDWDDKRAKQAVTDATSDDVEESRTYVKGDHYNGGDGWIGPKPTADNPDAANINVSIENGFVSKNAVLEIVRRHKRGVVGRESAWGFINKDVAANAPQPATTKPTPAAGSPTGVPASPAPKQPPKRKLLQPSVRAAQKLTAPDPGTTSPAGKPGANTAPVDPSAPTDATTADPLVTEADDAVTEWWNDRGVHRVMQESVHNLLVEGRSVLRIYIPAGLRQPDGSISAPDIASALKLIYVDNPTGDQAVVYTDEDTKRDIGVYTYERTNSRGDKEEGVEMVYLGPGDPSAPDAALVPTILRVIDKTNGDLEVELPYGGRIPMFEMKRTPLITPQVLENQRGLNLALSTIPRTVVTAGFLERVITNGMMPGTWTYDSAGNKKAFIPGRLNVGAGTTNYVQGIEVDQPDGKVSVTTPGVHFKEPTPATSAIEAMQAHYAAILEEADQSHILATVAANASGKSREEARADYEKSLNETKSVVDHCGRWLIETVLAVAEAIVGSPGQYTDALRADFTCFIDTGPVGADVQTSTALLVEKNIISIETGMSRVGVDDVDAEADRMNKQPGALLDIRTRQAAAMQGFIAVGLDHVTAAKLVGMTPDDVNLIAAAAPTPAELEQQRQADLAALAAGAKGNPGAAGGPPAAAPGGPPSTPPAAPSGNPIAGA